jgi:hypothetical protein
MVRVIKSYLNLQKSLKNSAVRSQTKAVFVEQTAGTIRGEVVDLLMGEI